MLKNDPERDPLAHHRVVREDGSFDAAAMHRGLNELAIDPAIDDPELLRLTDCLTALANLEAMRTYLVSTISRFSVLPADDDAKRAARSRIIGSDVGDLLEAAHYAAQRVCAAYEVDAKWAESRA